MKWVPAAALIASLFATPVMASPLQCAPYAREHSDVDLHGNAATWWTQAAGTYERGHDPRTGAVLVFKATGSMPYGHVAVIEKVVDARHVILNHANWSRPGMVERDAMAEDVSAAGDWSDVRVWYSPTHSLGLRPNAAFGFIYGPEEADVPAADTAIASSDADTASSAG
ncbi:CHAP domain-containing protein [Novosphingobium sp. 9]|uniref:CHAP domain-containing protein n=1 Tax=Novosphingobium sp. 9 TaxID=2025349 RepID=UPI0021B5B3C4|nr:CHAP domain-containing protein [Novosphingobium sp. 9]